MNFSNVGILDESTLPHWPFPSLELTMIIRLRTKSNRVNANLSQMDDNIGEFRGRSRTFLYWRHCLYEGKTIRNSQV